MCSFGVSGQMGKHERSLLPAEGVVTGKHLAKQKLAIGNQARRAMSPDYRTWNRFDGDGIQSLNRLRQTFQVKVKPGLRHQAGLSQQLK